MKKKAVFLDRDGTINKEIGYLYRMSDWEFVGESDRAIELIKKKGYLVVVVTNQSGIARQYYSRAEVDALHKNVNYLLCQTRGVEIDAFYVCPHHPNFTGKCACRKPESGMLIKAADDLDINLTISYMVGDKWSDVQAGLNCGCNAVLVKTGYGKSESEKNPYTVPIYKSLYEFAEWLH